MIGKKDLESLWTMCGGGCEEEPWDGAKILFLRVETYMRHMKERTSGPMAFISSPAAHGTIYR